MSLIITPDKQQALSANMQLALLKMPPAKRIRILKTLGRYEKKLAEKRIRAQSTVDGDPFEARASRSKEKMLRRLGKKLEPFVMKADRLELRHKARLTGRIAALQQAGGVERMTSAKMARKRGTPDYEAPCTKKQAKALIAEGYKVRKAKGKGWRKATVNEVMGKLKLGQAGLILRLMRGEKRKQSWNIPVPARPFLGDSTANVQRQLISIIEQINQSKRG